jgi:hypothetical protein
MHLLRWLPGVVVGIVILLLCLPASAVSTPRMIEIEPVPAVPPVSAIPEAVVESVVQAETGALHLTGRLHAPPAGDVRITPWSARARCSRSFR